MTRVSEAMSRWKTLVVGVGLMLCTAADSMRFDLVSGGTKCMSEDLNVNDLTLGKYSVVNPNQGSPLPDTHKITVLVLSPSGHDYHKGEHIESGTFMFTAYEKGHYSACFTAPGHKPPLTITIDFDWKKGVEAHDPPKVVKRGKVAVLELELIKMRRTVKAIHDELYSLLERGNERLRLQKVTSLGISFHAVFSTWVCFSVAGLQFWYLKTFFARKKLL